VRLLKPAHRPVAIGDAMLGASVNASSFAIRLRLTNRFFDTCKHCFFNALLFDRTCDWEVKIRKTSMLL
jgi:hypothetical protein